jgi:toxin YoeB
MAQQKKVVWSERAQKEKLKILDFWIQQNKSTSYSEKLNSVIEETLELLKNHPEIGRKTDIGEDIRMKFIGNYEVFYQLTKETIYILSIWNTRRNPSDFKL